MTIAYNLVAQLAKQNARDFIADAESAIKHKRFGHAFGFLVFAAEEFSKAQICEVYGSDLSEGDAASQASRKPVLVGITPKKLELVFKDHKAKRLTMATQLSLWLLNTHDAQKRNNFWNSWNLEDAALYSPLEGLLKLVKKINVLRDASLYIEKSGIGPDSVTRDDCEELLSVVKGFVQFDVFTTPRTKPGPDGNILYAEVERRVQTMLDRLT